MSKQMYKWGPENSKTLILLSKIEVFEKLSFKEKQKRNTFDTFKEGSCCQNTVFYKVFERFLMQKQ